MIPFIKRFFASRIPYSSDAYTIAQEAKKFDPAKMMRSFLPQPKKEGEFKRFEPFPGVIPSAEKASALAMDSTPYSTLNHGSISFGATFFPGYAYLARLSQQPEYRKISETIAKQMTRRFIIVKSKGSDDNNVRVAQMSEALEKFKVRQLFRHAAEHDGFFGRASVYIDLKMPKGSEPVSTDPLELASPLIIDPSKIPKDSLIGFNLIEPCWTYPAQYSSKSPMAADFYRPTSWYVMGQRINATRMLTFISRPLPDLLKPAYNFGGISMSQLAEPYVNNWLRTRDSVSDVVHAFTVMGIKTNMEGVLSGGDESDIFLRADLFNQERDNKGLMILDKETEEFFMSNVNLSNLDKLQAQAQEQMSTVSNIPFVYFFGSQPAGLNATSDSEIEVFDNFILSMKESIFTDNLNTIFQIIQLSEFGEIDPDIIWEYEPMSEMDPEQVANIAFIKAQTAKMYEDAMAIDGEDIRDQLINDPDSPYHGLTPNKVIEDVTQADTTQRGDSSKIS